MVEILHQNVNSEIACSIIVPQWKRTFYIKHKYIYQLSISNILVKMVEVFTPQSPDYIYHLAFAKNILSLSYILNSPKFCFFFPK